MQKAMLAIAVLSCIAQPAAAASRSDTTAAEAIILYKGGDRDLMVYFLGLGEGMAWANSYLQFTKAKQLYCGPPVLTNAQLFEALAGNSSCCCPSRNSARGHRGANPQQDRRLEEEGHVDGRTALARI